MKRLFQYIGVIVTALILFSSCQSNDNKEIVRNSIEDFKGEKIAVVTGGTQDDYFIKHYNGVIEPYHVETASDLIPPVLNGNVSAGITDKPLVKVIVNENPRLTIVPEPVFLEDLGLAFSDAAMRDKFNRFLANKRESGELDLLINKWEESYETAPMPVFESTGNGGTLIVGAIPAMPFSFYRAGEYCGIDVELISEFAASEDMTIKYLPTTFTSMVALVNSKKADVACGGITITEERSKKVFFSDVHYVSRSTLFTLKPQYTDEVSEKSWLTGIKESFYNNLIKEDRYLLIMDGLGLTLLIAILSIIFGTILGSVVCYARMHKNRILRTIASIYIGLLRGIPHVVLLMLMFYVVFAKTQIDGIWVAIITFAMNFAAYTSEMFRTSIESVDKGQTEAGVAMGFNRAKTFMLIVMPQAFKRVLPVFKGEVISLVKMTSIVGYIAVQDLTKAGDIIRSRTFDAFFPLIFIAVIYFALAWLLTYLLSLAERK